MRKTALITLLTTLLLGTILSTGCSNIKDPRFETMGVRLVEQTDTRTVYAFSIKATNPNKESIPLKEVSYTVKLDSKHSFSGVRSPETTLHTYGSHTFELPAVFEVSTDQLSGIVDYKITGSVKYLRPGKFNEVLFDTKVKVPKAGFTLRGKVNVDDPSAAALTD